MWGSEEITNSSKNPLERHSQSKTLQMFKTNKSIRMQQEETWLQEVGNRNRSGSKIHQKDQSWRGGT